MALLRVTILLGVLLVSACSAAEQANTYTLYRNSMLDNSMRIHWATFNANDSDRNYNRNNCEMAARLLNANVGASAAAEGKERDPSIGFWCEPGGYVEDGQVPTIFPAAFPTDA